MHFESLNSVKMRLWPGLCPGPLWQNLHSTSDPLADLGQGKEMAWKEMQIKRKEKAERK